jgi:glycosyltransferase involved in cell wall biosynthesis
MGEIITEGAQGFVVKDGTIAAYKEKINHIINNDTALKELSLNCRCLALDYCWQNQAEKYWSIYQGF